MHITLYQIQELILYLVLLLQWLYTVSLDTGSAIYFMHSCVPHNIRKLINWNNSTNCSRRLCNSHLFLGAKKKIPLFLFGRSEQENSHKQKFTENVTAYWCILVIFRNCHSTFLTNFFPKLFNFNFLSSFLDAISLNQVILGILKTFFQRRGKFKNCLPLKVLWQIIKVQ